MAELKKNLDHLAKGSKPEGLKPDETVKWGHLLAEKFAERPDKPTALGTRMRFSDAGQCARHLSLKAAGFEPEPMDIVGHHNTGLGEIIHESWQAVLSTRFPQANIEAVGSLEDCESSGSGDALVTTDDRTTLLEIKTCGGFAYKLAVGERGAAQGPKTEHILQLALNVRAHDADEGVLIYLSKEAISAGMAERKGIPELNRFVAEWTFTREQLDEYADAEIKRQAEILRLVDEGRLAPRHVPYEMPPGARIVDLDRSMWTLTDPNGDVRDTGDLWGGSRCAHYCSQRANCALFPDVETPEFRAAQDDAA